jgi:hypothetical protein
VGRKHLIWIAALLFFCVYIGSGVYTYLQRRAEIQRILQASANLGAQREPLREKLDMLREQECVIITRDSAQPFKNSLEAGIAREQASAPMALC